ncbi:glutathione hydrolase 5 proenzyme-like [Colossoma macropomum]|uniref:glutathione hydrolase 5 proenzyme-like n=1 Tax=Colossoma macropomum TaxID=42526 RepID=UPI001864AE59|nr:glutathione hydrolase 5 proenzyme-like [Colossoma macropomum]
MAGNKLYFGLFITIAIITVTIIVVLHGRKPPKVPCPGGSFRKAAVAADSEICSKVGRDILREGGSAADGAIAALLCTSVVNPQCMGIGGGAIFTIMDKNGTVKTINTRETVPKNFRGNLSDCSYDSTGSQWIGVPGQIRGYEHVHRLYGRLPWSSLFQPTIRMAREGVKISEILARYLSITERQMRLSAPGHSRDMDEPIMATTDLEPHSASLAIKPLRTSPVIRPSYASPAMEPCSIVLTISAFYQTLPFLQPATKKCKHHSSPV